MEIGNSVDDIYLRIKVVLGVNVSYDLKPPLKYTKGLLNNYS